MKRFIKAKKEMLLLKSISEAVKMLILWPHSPKQRHKMKHLTIEQRYALSAYLQAGFNQSEIAEKLHVHKSTISREIQRNGYSRYRKYKPRIAQYRAEYRWRNRKLPRRFKDDVRSFAQSLLEQDYSPEQIVGYCRKEGITMVSHETIYRWIWWDKRHNGYLHTHLRHRGRRYAKRSYSKKRRGIIPNRIDIDERPLIVEKRERFGDFEIDTIIGASHSQHILTIVDRTSGYGMLRKLRKGTAEEAAKQIIDLLKDFARMGLVKTITSDNGSQFYSHQIVSEKLQAGFYFAKPYHSWERGSNENFNGLVRQYIPKSADFKNISETFLDEVEYLLNSRPRKRLNYDSPLERLNQLTGLKSVC